VHLLVVDNRTNNLSVHYIGVNKKICSCPPGYLEDVPVVPSPKINKYKIRLAQRLVNPPWLSIRLYFSFIDYRFIYFFTIYLIISLVSVLIIISLTSLCTIHSSIVTMQSVLQF